MVPLPMAVSVPKASGPEGVVGGGRSQLEDVGNFGIPMFFHHLFPGYLIVGGFRFESEDEHRLSGSGLASDA